LLAYAFEHAKISLLFYEVKKTINKLSLNYTQIFACSNYCMLYLGEDTYMDSFKKCKTSRLKKKKGTELVVQQVINKKKIPTKILRYFPLKSCL